MSLKDVTEAFNPDSEEDLRFAVALYFCELGFERDELSFEDQFSIQLGRNTQVLGRSEKGQRDQVTGRSDLLLTRDGESVAIVETKAPDHHLTEDDAWQALSYASLLRPVAPYAIVTNGAETQVYDTLASITHDLTPLDNPADSEWSTRGQQALSIGDDLRAQAARILIGVNPQTLASFCRDQLNQALEDLKGTPQEGKIYIPDTYLSRQSIADEFNAWLTSDLPCFAAIGDSGIGKTNFMCATAEILSEGSFVLFYPAMRLPESLLTAICNDFTWEFHQDRGPAYIINRFDEIARKHDQKFVIFVDGLDEFPGERDRLKAELLDLVQRLRNRSVYLCVSCKSLDWSGFVIDKGQTYNRLANSVYPLSDIVRNPPGIQRPDSHQIGIWLSKFTDGELDAILPKYREAFSLQGDLQGATRAECQNPLTLRLVAEAYSGSDVDLPTNVLSREVFDKYWERKLDGVRKPLLMERMLVTVADMCIESGKHQVLLSALCANLDIGDSIDDVYHDAKRFGLLREMIDKEGYRWVAFGFEKLRSYVYTVKGQAWRHQDPQDTAKIVCELLGNPLGIEAVEFYLTTVDRGETRMLTELGA
jgi:hypothetical protein